MTFQTQNPYTNQIIKTYHYMSLEQAQVKIEQADADQKKWAGLDLQSRTQILKKIAEKFEMQKDSLALQICLEMGKPMRQAQDEIRKCIMTLSEVHEVAEQAMRTNQLSAHYKQVSVKPEAYGLVLSIQPWNFPFWQVVRMATCALATGNLVLLKHSDIVAGCAEMLEGLFAVDDFKLIVNLVLTHKDTARVIADTKVKMLTFTGSTAGGSAVAALAGQYLKKSLLELGGSDAYIVLEDADVELAASMILKSRTLNSGQSCICAKRVFVHDSVQALFKDIYLSKAKLLKLGDPFSLETDIGPLAHSRFIKTINDQIAQSEKSGGVFCKVENENHDQQKFSPLGLIDFGSELKAFEEIEIFGPVLSFYSFSHVEQVVKTINLGPFGLGGGVFSTDWKRAQELAEKLSAGTVVINNIVQTGLKVPFGGRRQSGYGYELGVQGFSEFISWKVVAC